jgi:purine-binding chemotaxis protein CheW
MATSTLAAADNDTTAENLQLVVFRLGDDDFALPIDTVKEVVHYTEPRKVNSVEPGITGVISLRGKITPIYDLAARLGLTPVTQQDERRIVILETEDARSGLVVDAVSQITTVSRKRLEQHQSFDPHLISAVARLEDDHLVVLLNPTAYMPES